MKTPEDTGRGSDASYHGRPVIQTPGSLWGDERAQIETVTLCVHVSPTRLHHTPSTLLRTQHPTQMDTAKKQILFCLPWIYTGRALIWRRANVCDVGAASNQRPAKSAPGVTGTSRHRFAFTSPVWRSPRYSGLPNGTGVLYQLRAFLKWD